MGRLMNAWELKIIFIISKMGMGGAQRIVLDLANSLAAREAQVELLIFYRTPQDASILSQLDPRIRLTCLTSVKFKADHVRPLGIQLLLLPLRALGWALRRRLGRYHIVHANLLAASVFTAFCSLFWRRDNPTRPRFVETFHADLINLYWWERLIFGLTWRQKDRLILELRRKDVGILRKSLSGRVVHIPFGIPALDAPTPPALDAARVDLVGRPAILSVTRLNQREKRVLDLIEIVHRFHQLHKGTFLFLLVGDGPDRAAAQELVENLGLSGCVRFTGYLDDFRALCKASRAFLIAGVEDLVGIAGLQAASLGTPIVSFQMDPEWEAGEGLFFNTASHQAAAEELEKLVSDPAYHAKASAYVSEIVRTRFSLERMATSTLEVYLSLLNPRQD